MQLQSKGRWYSWKRGLIERLGPDVKGILDEVVVVSHLSIEGSVFWTWEWGYALMSRIK